MSRCYYVILLLIPCLSWGAGSQFNTTTVIGSGTPIEWTPFSNQPSAGEIVITFVAPPQDTTTQVLISRGASTWGEGAFAVWIWNGQIHARIGGATNTGILRPKPGSVDLTPGQSHEVRFFWDSRVDGGVGVIVDGTLTIYDWRSLEGTDAMTGQAVWLTAAPEFGNPFLGQVTYSNEDLPSTYDKCGALEATADGVTIPRHSSCPAPPPPPPPPPPGDWNGAGISLKWVPPTENEDGTPLTDLAGYKIYWATTGPGDISTAEVLDLPQITDKHRLILPSSDLGVTYFVWMRAYNELDTHSRNSNVVNFVVDNKIPGRGNVLDIIVDPGGVTILQN